MGYLLAEAGVTVTGQSGGILPVLVFGAGTDYALLLVSRYREELRSHEDKHDAVRIAMRKAGPAIVASGLTVMAALLTLTLAEVTGTSGLGPIGALGVGLAMVSMLTILPGAAGDHRAQGVLAVHPAGRQRRASTRRTASGAGSPPGSERARGASGSARRSSCSLLCLGLTSAEQRPDQRQRLPRRRRLGRGPGAGRAERSQRAPTRRRTSWSRTSRSWPPSRTRSSRRPGVAEINPEVERGPDRRQVRGHARGGSAQHRGLRPHPGHPRRRGRSRRRRRARRRARRRRSTTCASHPHATTG